MRLNIPEISEQVYKEDTLKVLENKYSILGPMWVNHQVNWFNDSFLSFKDHDKYLIVIYLIKNNLDFLARNFHTVDYNQFYLNGSIEIEKLNIIEISKALNIPKETTRRKVDELQNLGAITKHKKKIFIDRSVYTYVKPLKLIQNISHFLSFFSKMLLDKNNISKSYSSTELQKIIEEKFSYFWKIYYELQIPMALAYKKIFKDLETFHIFGTCVNSQHLYAKRSSEDNMDRDEFIDSTYTPDKMTGINAMSISDITGIPRATVIRKLEKLLKQKKLKIDNKKHYKLTGNFINELKPTQKAVLIDLANFSTKIYNL